ncbi:MAG TPA: hypothetical protein VFU04_07540 [Solirubrobacterales bacterium]|nr:hypothetical protein [Solirubrobacterales bacterium]
MSSLFFLFAQAQAAAPPAGGAALDQVVIASVAASIVTAALVLAGFAHRAGRFEGLRRLAAWAERISGYPGWVAVPAAITTVSLLLAVFGMYWDIALHIGVGRDEGPLANPAHYFILVGLFGIFAAGFLAIVLPEGKPSAASIRLGSDWHAPLGGVLIMACGLFSLTGFPLDDVWHRLFGQDVTLWGPTHLMLIGGASMSLVGLAILTVEGLRAKAAAGGSAGGGEHTAMSLARAVALTGGLMLGLSTFQAEFDFGVPQFRFVFEPVMIMLAAGVGLVVARLYAGPGAALGAAGFFVAMRGLLALVIGPGLGETTPHFPHYVVEALVVEAIAWGLSAKRPLGERPLAFGIWAGLGIGTGGFAAEWLWSHIWMPLPWPAELFPEAALLGFAAALAGAQLGAWIGTRLALDVPAEGPGDGRERRRLRVGAGLGAAVIAVIVAFSLYAPADEGVSGRVELSEVGGAPGEARVTLKVDPPNAAEGAEWLTVTAWQGDGLVVEPLERIGAGAYRSEAPIPVHGNWKAMIRLHDGSSLTALPIYMQADDAIPAPEVPASPAFTRSFVDETQILQREQTGGSPLLVLAAYSTVVAITLSLLALLVWGLHRLAFGPAPRKPGTRRRALRPRYSPISSTR